MDFAEDETGTFALVRAYDPSYRLCQRRGITSFNDVTDGDVIRQLARDAGIRLYEVTPADESLESVFSYLVQS